MLADKAEKDGNMPMKDERIVLAVVFGGQSSEHEVSRVSAQSVLENVNPGKYDVRMIGITKQGEWLRYEGDLSLIGTGEWEDAARNQRRSVVAETEVHADALPGSADDVISGLQASGRASSCLSLLSPYKGRNPEAPVDVVFPVLHGPNGEDGSIQGVFQLADVPYVGCGVFASAAGMDKTFSKIVFSHAGIAQARHLTILRNELDGTMDVFGRQVAETLGYPCFVKPASAGSSVGVAKVKSPERLEPALREAAVFDSKIMVEEFIDGREIECAILGNEEPIASVPGEVIPCNEFYDYKAKYIDNRSETRIPADLTPEVAEQVQRLAIRAFKALGASGLSRVDFFLERGTDRIVLNEINTMPGFTSISMYAKLWAASGIPYPELVDRLVELAIERHEASGISFDRTVHDGASRGI
jgi:D-alanine-D-alanine ligase